MKKRIALIIFLQGIVFFVGTTLLAIAVSPAFILGAVPSGWLIGWFGMEFFYGDGSW